MPSNFYENKLINIKQGCKRLSCNTIESYQYWSFWHSLGRPNTANGFVVGRNLVNGELSTQIGGGLCQLSSIIYHLALLAGLTVIERHPHSIDIYHEHLRFTPLGSDATVVWGVKDLRLFNPHSFPIVFHLSIQDSQLKGELHSSEQIELQQVEFKRTVLTANLNQVDTVVNNSIASTHIYEHKPV